MFAANELSSFIVFEPERVKPDEACTSHVGQMTGSFNRHCL